MNYKELTKGHRIEYKFMVTEELENGDAAEYSKFATTPVYTARS